MPKQQTVFISCGQFTADEKQLGAAICELVEELTAFKPYFAEYQTSLEGLTENILGALNESIGLIAILHPRGTVTYGDGGSQIRGSVWVEQEIAIAAFISQIVGRNLQTAAFVHESVGLEGMRAQLLLNPRKFKSNNDVLDHLRKVLPGWSTEDGLRNKEVVLAIKWNQVKISSERHDYELEFDITNNGSEKIDEYQIDVSFPDTFLNQTIQYGREVYDRRTQTHRLFRAVSRRGLDAIYPGDTCKALTVPYYVDDDNFRNKSEHLDDKVTATLYLSGFEPQVLTKRMRELQNF
jgi:hypothetical protein